MVRRVALALALLCSVAAADDKPWAAGVSQAKQDAAFKTYAEANELFAQGDYKRALEKYDAALAQWDHPGIRYNRAVCLINLDRPVEAYQDLEAALKYGEEPLGKDLYNEGLNYQKLLSRQVAELEITAKDKGAKISLDGKPLVLVGGHANTLVAVSQPHEITAAKSGYQTFRKPLEHLPAGQRTTIEVKLQPLEHGAWRPWAVIAGGAVVSGVGVYFYSLAKSDIDTYEKAVANYCPCSDDADLFMRSGVDPNILDRSHTREIIGYSALALGGVTIATGIVLVVRGRHHEAHVAPAVGKDSMGVSFSGSW